MAHTTTLSKRGTTTVSAEVRAALKLQTGDQLTWRVNRARRHSRPPRGRGTEDDAR